LNILKRFFSALLAVVIVFSAVSFELANVSAGNSTVNGGKSETQASAPVAAAPESVYTWSINSYISGTTTAIIPAVTGSTTTSNYVLNAVAQDIPGYLLTPWDQSPVSVTLTQPNTNVNFYYVAKIYTITFESNGGTAVTAVSQAYQTMIAQPTNPVKENYQFTGWYTDAACTHLVTWPYSMPLLGGTLYAGWYIAPVTLTFNSNNGTAISPVTATPGTSVQKPTDPTRSRFRFDGWYYDISFTQPVTWPLSMPFTATTIYAKWTFIQYTITFDSTGGTTVSPITSQPNTAVYPPNDPARTGYTFGGWYYDNSTFANPAQWPIIMGSVGFTLYAKWVPNSITITFDSNGGTAVDPLTADAGSSISAPNAPRKFGYLFTGWTLDGNPYGFSVMPTQDTTLVASWTASARAAWVSLATYKTVSGQLVPATSARAGDIVTVVVTPKTNFYCGASRYIIMYDSNFYTIVGANKAAITPNASNPYYANAISAYGGQTTNLPSQWPSTFINGESSQYMFVAANFTASSQATNGGYPLMLSDSTSLFSIKLQVKANATGSGRIFMDNRWDRSSTNTTGAQYYFYCPSGTVLSSSGNSILDFDTDYVDADKTVALDTSVPVYSNINFNTNGGSAIAALNGQAGTIASPPANPVREGYTFTGWSPAFPSYYPNSDITLTAQWQINTYNAIFMVDGVVYATVPTQYGATIAAPSNPVKVGYSFVSWSPSVSTMGSADKTFTAMFLINSYNAVFMVDGSTYATALTEYGAAIQAPSNPQKTGYTFTGWSPVVGTMGAANITFTAQFSINTYYAYFVVDGQTIATVPTQYGAQIQAPANPTKAGYSFTGWSPTVGAIGAANITFTAQWIATVYNVYFKYTANGTTYATVVTVVGAVIAVPANPVRDGYTFTGWDSVPSVMPAHDVTVTAQWTINTYTVTFKVDGATYATVPTVFGAVIALPVAPAKTGYTFNGWTNLPATMPSQNLTLNAAFTANTYTATFKVDGAVYANVPTQYGTEIVAPANPVKTGYTFISWLNVPATMPANNVTINASFSINSYTVRFIVDGVTYSTATAPFGSVIQVPANPDKVGYTFTGWDSVPATMPASNVDINATFSKNVYKAIFMVDGVQYAVVETGYGETINLPAVPNKTGYSFLAWNNLPDTMPNSDVTITGTWAINSYDAVFTVDGQGYADVATQYGAPIQLPTAPVKSGFYFGGWSPLVPASMPAYSLEFTAQWVSVAYNAIFMVDGVHYATVLTGLGAPIVAPANPTKTGFLFLGWDPGLPSAMPAQDLTFNALWYSLSNVTVTFNLNGGTGTVPANQVGLMGTAVTLPAKGNIARQYYNFLGWATSSSATAPLSSYSIPSSNVTLYAVWSRVPVTLAAKAGSTTIINQTKGFIYGLEEGMTKADFLSSFVTINGNGSLRITPYTDSFGTQTKVELLDNVTGLVVKTYYIIIFGDVDGDGYVTAADENILGMVASYQMSLDEGSAIEYAADLTQDQQVDTFDLNLVSAATNYSGTISQTNPSILI
jgi:uncharacterized repeat protein (TIGR02543 family)